MAGNKLFLPCAVFTPDSKKPVTFTQNRRGVIAAREFFNNLTGNEPTVIGMLLFGCVCSITAVINGDLTLDSKYSDEQLHLLACMFRNGLHNLGVSDHLKPKSLPHEWASLRTYQKLAWVEVWNNKFPLK